MLLASSPFISRRGYKEEQEAFVSNLRGTSIVCLVACLAHIPLLVFILSYVQRGLNPHILREFFIFVIPIILVLTVCADYSYWSLLSLFASLIVLRSTQNSGDSINNNANARHSSKASSSAYLGRVCQGIGIASYNKYYLTLFKGTNVLVTCVAILAIDFRIFPRRFGKTESFGLSLMDIGTGTFIISSAITSRFARGLPSPSFRKLSVQRLAVLLLGIGRFVSVKLLGYQEHVGEYGLHWNFFLTLFAVWGVSDMLHHCIARRYILWIAILIVALYQGALVHTPLTEYMVSSARVSLLDANKEGVVSLLGYLPLYLIAESLSFNLFFNRGSEIAATATVTIEQSSSLAEVNEKEVVRVPSSSLSSSPSIALHRKSSNYASTEEDFSSNINEEWRPSISDSSLDQRSLSQAGSCLDRAFVNQMIWWLGAFWMIWFFSAAMIQPTSRRLCNATYISLVLALSLTLILGFYFVEIFAGSVALKSVIHANKYSLFVFLGANVLTGLINMSIKTIYAPPIVALLVIAVYSFAVTAIAWFADLEIFKVIQML